MTAIKLNGVTLTVDRMEVSEMFEVKDRWGVTLRRFEDRADAEAFIALRRLERLEIVERI